MEDLSRLESMRGEPDGAPRRGDLDLSEIVTLRDIPGDALARIDKYALVRELGGGGFGTVYLARDTVAKIDRAVKGLPPEVKGNPEELENIRANFALVSRLHHPNIAAALDLHRAEHVWYGDEKVRENLRVSPGETLMVMEYAPGLTLSKWRRQFPGGRVPLAQALEITRQVAAALDYAHEQRIIHRDVKPSNVMVETKKDGRLAVRVLDFGLAAEIRSSMGRVSREVRDTSGTRPYMAPEQWLGEDQTAPTDQYALAVLFHELVTGKVPFASVFETNDIDLMKSAVTTQPFAAPPELPKPVRAALAKVLAKKPSERFASCGAFASALAGRGRGGGAKAALAAVFLAVLAVGGALLWRGCTEGTGEPVPPPVTPPVSVSEPATPVPEPLPAATPDRTAEESQKDTEAYVLLKTRINIKKSDAKDKMGRIEAFRSEKEGFEERLESADRQWKTISALAEPGNLAEARAAFAIADEAEKQIVRDLDWLVKNKAGRDAAKAASEEIAALLKGDAATFEAEKYAPKAYGEGVALRKQGTAAFKKGEFAEARRLMGQARARFAAAVGEAKAFAIKTALKSAETYLKASEWSEWSKCVAECDKVLGWDASNAPAKELKSNAEAKLVPSLTLVAKIGGREVRGAKVRVGGGDRDSPVEWKKLSADDRLGPYTVTYTEKGRCYEGIFAAVNVDWQGPKTIPVSLKEYTRGDTKTLKLPGGATIEMIYVAPGSFTMGSENGENDEKPVHTVRITKGYWLGKYEVTQTQWRSVMGGNPSYFTGDDRNPVEQVSWDDCQTFIEKVNAQLHCGARLPTESEWEYVCRAGTRGAYAKAGIDAYTSEHPAAEAALEEMGWYNGNSGGRTHPVGQKAANPWGFHDMHGNVWEWCADRYGDYPSGSVTDPTGPASGSCRVLRGGSWYGHAQYCRSANRDGDDPSGNYYDYGFRLCCSAGLQ